MAETRNTRPKGMPYNPSETLPMQALTNVSERQQVGIEAIQEAIQASPEVVANGYRVTKDSAMRAVLEAGIVAKAADLGIDLDTRTSQAQGAFDEWLADDENAEAYSAWDAARRA